MDLFAAKGYDGTAVRVLAQRAGIDPVTDLRPRVLAAVIGAPVSWSTVTGGLGQDPGPEAMAGSFDADADAVVPALTGHWSRD